MALWTEAVTDKTKYPDETKITLADGTETTFGEIRSGYMKDADYRKKTSDLAREREQVERELVQRQQAIHDAEARVMDLVKTAMTRNPQVAPDEIVEQIDSSPVAKRLKAEIDELKTALGPMAKALLTIDKQMKDSYMATLAGQHQRKIDELKAKDPDLVVEDLLGYAQKNMIPRLDIAYNDMNRERIIKSERETALQDGIKQGYEKAKRELMAPSIPVRLPSMQPNAEAPANLDDAVNRALQDPDILNPLMGFSGAR